MDYETLASECVIPLTDNIVYDEVMDEVVVRIGRIHVGFTTEEFAIISQEIAQASKLMFKVLLNKVQQSKSEEIN